MPIFMHIHSHCKPSLIIASTSALEEEQLSFHTSNYTEEDANASACRHMQKRSLRPQTVAMKRTTAPPVQTLVHRKGFHSAPRHYPASWLAGYNYSCWEGHLSESELGCGLLVSSGGLQGEARRLWRTLSFLSCALIQSFWQGSAVPLSASPVISV